MTHRFAITSWDINKNRDGFLFHYECSHLGGFTEEVRFPRALPEGFETDYASLLDITHCVIGVSYYKTKACGTIDINHALSPDAHAMIEALYNEGLAEFYVRNDLPYPPQLTINTVPPVNRQTPVKKTAYTPTNNTALVAFGGGKDSYVALSIMEKAGYACETVSIILSDAVKEALNASATRPLTLIKRTIDPKLIELNARTDIYNGHIPVTAINSFILLLWAAAQNIEAVVFANERSADEETVTINGVQANHQFSKTSMMEELLRNALSHISAPDYFSVLRSHSELMIGQQFAALDDDIHHHFLSCNKNFKSLRTDTRKRWCGECPKCAFTSLILSPFISKEKHIQIFGDDFLTREALFPYFRELLGLSEQKPWECVGTIDECRIAVWDILRHNRIHNDDFLGQLWAQTGLGAHPEKIEHTRQNLLTPSAVYFYPERLKPHVFTRDTNT